jgi:hypothetical protein
VLHPEAANTGEIIKRIIPESKSFPPSVRKGKLRLRDGKETEEMYDIPDGILEHLTRECSGNVHDRQVVEVTSGSFEKETHGANPHSGAYDNDPMWWRRRQLIWKRFRVSSQLIAAMKKKTRFHPRGTIGCAMISERGGLCQHTTQSARMRQIRAVRI